MATDVSMRPRNGRSGSGTRLDVRGRHAIEIVTQSLPVNVGRSLERRDGGVGANEATPAQRGEFSDGNAVSRHDVGVAGV